MNAKHREWCLKNGKEFCYSCSNTGVEDIHPEMPMIPCRACKEREVSKLSDNG